MTGVCTRTWGGSMEIGWSERGLAILKSLYAAYMLTSIVI